MPPVLSRYVVAALGLSAVLGMLVALAGCGATSHTTAAPLPSGSASSVTVQTDITTYSTSQPIGVTIHNASKTTYYALSGQSACTPLQMQRQVGTGWQNVMPCSTSEQPHSIAIPAGLIEPFTFAPGNAPNDRNAWAPGIYRFALQLSPTANGTGTAVLTYSPGIRIVAPPS